MASPPSKQLAKLGIYGIELRSGLCLRHEEAGQRTGKFSTSAQLALPSFDNNTSQLLPHLCSAFQTRRNHFGLDLCANRVAPAWCDPTVASRVTFSSQTVHETVVASPDYEALTYSSRQ